MNISDTSQTCDIRIGTSGFSFEDWRGPFYPQDLPKNKLLEYYAQSFGTVEINSTYYGIPRPSVAESMVSRTPSTFDYMVKTHASFTHSRDASQSQLAAFFAAVQPFAEAGRLAGILAQFPYSFKYNDTNMDYLLRASETITQSKLYIEFRHDSWYQRPIYYRLKEVNTNWVSVDLPKLSHMPMPHALCTDDTAYIRLHGRNSEKWYGGGDRRYDYGYSSEELEEWRQKIDKLKPRAKKIYVFFNNCYRGQAVKNAKELIDLFQM